MNRTEQSNNHTIKYEEFLNLQSKANQQDAGAQNALGWFYCDGRAGHHTIDHGKAFDCFKNSADQKNSFGQHGLGFCYRDGIGVPKDLSDEDRRVNAVAQFRLSADQENPYGQNSLGECYKTGHGVEQNLKQAFELFTESANKNNEWGQLSLGLCYQNGEGTATDLEKAFECFKKSAEQGNKEAQYRLGLCYKNGSFVEKLTWEQSQSKALEWFRKSAEQGHTVAKQIIDNTPGRIDLNQTQGYEHVITELTKNNNHIANTEFQDTLRLAKEGDAEAWYKIARFYDEGQHVEKNLNLAFLCFLLSAETGNADAQNMVGWFYLDGRASEQQEKNSEKAFYWFNRSASQYNSYGENGLGCCYKNNIGVPGNLSEEQRLSKAVEFYNKSAEQGNSFGQNSLGECYKTGHGVEQNLKQAFELFTESANKNNEWGQLNLGLCYQNGEGTATDLEKAFEYFKKSAEQGNAVAGNQVESIRAFRKNNMITYISEPFRFMGASKLGGLDDSKVEELVKGSIFGIHFTSIKVSRVINNVPGLGSIQGRQITITKERRKKILDTFEAIKAGFRGAYPTTYKPEKNIRHLSDLKEYCTNEEMREDYKKEFTECVEMLAKRCGIISFFVSDECNYFGSPYVEECAASVFLGKTAHNMHVGSKEIKPIVHQIATKATETIKSALIKFN